MSTDAKLSLKESAEYLFDVKLTNFKIMLEKFVYGLESIDTLDEELEKSINKGVGIMDEYDVIHEKFKHFLDDKSPTNVKNLENNIRKLKDVIREMDVKIDEKTIELNNEQKNLKETNIKLEKTNKLLLEYENILHKQGEEICILKKKDKDNETFLKTEMQKNQEFSTKSKTYIETLNNGNDKLLNAKSEKIKELNDELSKVNKKLILIMDSKTSLEETIKEQKIQLENIISSYETKIKEVEYENAELKRQNNELVTNLNTKINEKMFSTNLETELLIIQQKEELEKLNRQLKEVSSSNDLSRPLLVNDKDKNERCYCNVM